MTSFIRDLYDFFQDGDESLNNLAAILDRQAAEQSLGGVHFSNEWLEQRASLNSLLKDKTDESLSRALKIFAKVIDTLDLYAPALKGLTDVHVYACEALEGIIFDRQKADQLCQAAAFLYGRAMAMSSLTAEAAALAIENLLLRGDQTAANLALVIILGVERSSPLLFETHLPVLLRQVQRAAFSSETHLSYSSATPLLGNGVGRVGDAQDMSVAQEALIRALKVYSPSEKAASCQTILQSTHALLVDSLALCQEPKRAEEGVIWTCFMIEHIPMLLRNDLRHRYQDTITPLPIFNILLPLAPLCSPTAQSALCSALPLLATWETSAFVENEAFEGTVRFMLRLSGGMRAVALEGLGQLASAVLDRFEPFLEEVGNTALGVLKEQKHAKTQRAGQKLLARLLASQGPTTLEFMMEYLRSPHHILLADVELLVMIAILLPNLERRVIQTLTDIMDDLLWDKCSEYPAEAVLEALNVFPLNDMELAARAQRLVLWSLEEERGKDVAIAALQLSTNPNIATPNIIHNLTYKVAQLLLADDPNIVHVALSVLSHPALASMLDERSCSMILLALHQSLEPSIQIAAAKLLTHLTTAHRAIVQPLAWNHIRQSLSLMDFMLSVDPTRAIIEASIISNLLPALPTFLHKKYVGPVKELIMTGLRRPSESHVISLVFQGLSNLARFEDYSSTQQSQLAQNLLDMTQEIPKECQYAALNAVSSILSVPKKDLDVYELLVKVHAVFGGVRGGGLDGDLKALVSGIFGYLGTVERNPVMSRDSKAAINRETLNYPPKIAHLSRVSEIRDRHGSCSTSHINTLLSENLLSALSTSLKATDDRSLVLETMSCLAILQPRSMPALLPDLPGLIMRELRYALKSRDKARDLGSTSVSAGLLLLSSTIHTSGEWLETYWMEMAELMVECISREEGLPVLRALDVVLDAVDD